MKDKSESHVKWAQLRGNMCILLYRNGYFIQYYVMTWIFAAEPCAHTHTKRHVTTKKKLMEIASERVRRARAVHNMHKIESKLKHAASDNGAVIRNSELKQQQIIAGKRKDEKQNKIREYTHNTCCRVCFELDWFARTYHTVHNASDTDRYGESVAHANSGQWNQSDDKWNQQRKFTISRATME